MKAVQLEWLGSHLRPVLGLGGFFDGIVFHQILQWHHMVTSAGFPSNTLANLQFNTLLDGLFHAATYLFVGIGVLLLWLAAKRDQVKGRGSVLVGSLLMGFGVFNVFEGLVNHHLLGIHHVNETVNPAFWFFWDAAFLLWGAAMIVGGRYLSHRQ